MFEVTLVKADDWGGVYIDDELYHEGHSIPDFVWVEVLRKAGVPVIDNSESKEAYAVIEAHGRCPQTLSTWDAIARDGGLSSSATDDPGHWGEGVSIAEGRDG